MGYFLSILTGLSGGIVVGSAACAFYGALGVFSKMPKGLPRGLKTPVYLSAFLGTTYGAWQYLYEFPVPGGVPLEILFGAFSGIFIGSYIALLAEVVNIIPFMRRNNLTKKLIGAALIAFSLGKMVGVLYYHLKL